MEYDKNSVSTLTWNAIELSKIDASVFGGLCTWSLLNLIICIKVFRKRQNVTSGLNMLQVFLVLFKTIVALVYVTYFNLNCEARGLLVNVPLVIAWDIIYIIILRKLLKYTPHPRVVTFIYSILIMLQISIVMSGVILGENIKTIQFTCRNRYPLIYRQQYVIDIILEFLVIFVLGHALMYNTRSGTWVNRTKEIFQELKEKEEFRIFIVLFFVFLKIILSYGLNSGILGFNPLALTHFIDSCRSNFICCMIIREERKKIKEAKLKEILRNTNR